MKERQGGYPKRDGSFILFSVTPPKDAISYEPQHQEEADNRTKNEEEKNEQMMVVEDNNKTNNNSEDKAMVTEDNGNATTKPTPVQETNNKAKRKNKHNIQRRITRSTSAIPKGGPLNDDRINEWRKGFESNIKQASNTAEYGNTNYKWNGDGPFKEGTDGRLT